MSTFIGFGKEQKGRTRQNKHQAMASPRRFRLRKQQGSILLHGMSSIQPAHLEHLTENLRDKGQRRRSLAVPQLQLGQSEEQYAPCFALSLKLGTVPCLKVHQLPCPTTQLRL